MTKVQNRKIKLYTRDITRERVKQVVFLHDREITTAITNNFQYSIKLLDKKQK